MKNFAHRRIGTLFVVRQGKLIPSESEWRPFVTALSQAREIKPSELDDAFRHLNLTEPEAGQARLALQELTEEISAQRV